MPKRQPPGPASTPVGAVAVASAMEDALAYAARANALLAAVDDTAIFDLTPDGEVRTWTPAAQRAVLYTADEVAGWHFSRFHTPEALAAGEPARLLDTARALGRAEGKGWYVRGDGSMFYAGAVVQAMYDADGVLDGFAVVCRDITVQYAAEGTGRRVQAFLAILAHELRNPLAPMRNAVDVIRLTPTADTRIQHCAEIIGRQLQLLTRLVADLMDVGRVTTGKLKVQPVPTMYKDIVTAAVEAIRPALDTAGQSLTVTLPEGPVFVNADAGRVGQVLSNLLSNATKYTPRGGAISIQVAAEGGNVITAIGDSGKGIAPQALDRIFNLFAQEGDDAARGGLGIGLALARAVVEAHGGAIQASSGGVGCGSTFTVILPEVEMDGASVPRAMVADSAGQRILIVDDSADSADSMAELLTVLGHDARPAYSGMQALAMVRSFTPDIVLLDLEMPDMTGFEVLEALRGNGDGMACGALRVFALTGRSTPDDRKRTLAAGFDEHLVKPLTIEALSRALAGDGAG